MMNAATSSAAPTNTAGTGPIVTPSGHWTPPAAGFWMTVSQAQPLLTATPLPPISARAHGLYALTLAYG